MTAGIREETVSRLYRVQVQPRAQIQRKSVAKNAVANAGGDDSVKKKPVRAAKKPKPNDPCPCGKRKPNGNPYKYKECCGRASDDGESQSSFHNQSRCFDFV